MLAKCRRLTSGSGSGARKRDDQPSRSSRADQEVADGARDHVSLPFGGGDPHRPHRDISRYASAPALALEQPDHTERGVRRRNRGQPIASPERVVANEADSGDPGTRGDVRVQRKMRLPAVRRGCNAGLHRPDVVRVRAVRGSCADRRGDLRRDNERCRHNGHGYATEDSSVPVSPGRRRVSATHQHDPPAYIGPGPGSCAVFAPRLRRNRANARPPWLTLSCSVQPHSAHVTAGVSSAWPSPTRSSRGRGRRSRACRRR